MDSRARSSSLRKGRFSQVGQIYFITSTTHQRNSYFSDWQSGRVIVNSLRQVESLGEAKTLTFVVMPDHLHWLIELDKGTLASVVRRMKSMSAIALNDLCNSPGRKVWQSGFYDHALRSEEDLRDISRYIVANPLRAGLVKKLGDYPLWDAVWL
jgi:REP element-mobilizing transposase RayT